jgi:diacylglycerol kinase
MKQKQSLASAFRNAFHGVKYVFTSQRNAKIHLIATFLVILTSIIFHITKVEWILIIIAIGLVWLAECFNTALEKLTDLVSPDYHDLAKATKDSSAAAVLIAAITSAIIGILVFFPYLLHFIY